MKKTSTFLIEIITFLTGIINKIKTKINFIIMKRVRCGLENLAIKNETQLILAKDGKGIFIIDMELYDSYMEELKLNADTLTLNNGDFIDIRPDFKILITTGDYRKVLTNGKNKS